MGMLQPTSSPRPDRVSASWTEHPAREPDVFPVYLRLLGPNQWPPDDVLRGFQRTLDRWFLDVGNLAGELMALLAHGLGLPENHFETLFGTERMSFIRRGSAVLGERPRPAVLRAGLCRLGRRDEVPPGKVDQ